MKYQQSRNLGGHQKAAKDAFRRLDFGKVKIGASCSNYTSDVWNPDIFSRNSCILSLSRCLSPNKSIQ